MTISELLSSFLALDEVQQREFLARAYEAVQVLPFDEEWIQEVQHRSAEADAGRMESYDWETASKLVRDKYMPDA
jgi:hypothetical protein